MNYYKLVEQIKKDEGFTPVSFWDYKQWTWGFGTKAPGPNAVIDIVAAEKELLQHLMGSVSAYYELFGCIETEINEVRKLALINMIYNLGKQGVANFKKMVAAIMEDNWELAAAEAKDSKWYNQVGRRARRIVEELRTGKEVG